MKTSSFFDNIKVNVNTRDVRNDDNTYIIKIKDDNEYYYFEKFESDTIVISDNPHVYSNYDEAKIDMIKLENFYKEISIVPYSDIFYMI